MFEIKTPATSANIGPGFDTLGLSFNKYNYVNFKKDKDLFKISGSDSRFLNEDNLIYRSFRETEKLFYKNPENINIDVKSCIPQSRGLGSSASCVVSGVVGAMLMHGININKKDILSIATTLEGHPDNVAPCIYGGLTASFTSNKYIYTEKYEVSKDIKFYAFVPDFELSTKDSRNILPYKVKHSDAVFNLSRIPFLIKGLIKGDMDLIKESIEDKLHQPYREKIVNEIDYIKDIIKNSGNAYYLSGAGPTVMCISKNETFEEKFNKEILSLKKNWKILKLEVDNAGIIYRRK